MILHDKKIVYLHPSRCGGSSIERALGVNAHEFATWKSIALKNKPHIDLVGYTKENGWEQHLEWEKSKHLIPGDYYVFVSIRNPYNRAESQINYMGKNNFQELINLYNDDKSGLQSFVNPQWKYVYDDKMNLIVDDIVRICDGENSGWDEVQKKQNLPNLPHVNVGSKKYKLTEKDKELIQDFYKKDFELFNYPL